MKAWRIALALACAAAPAAADTIAVKVTEVAGDVAYVTPGRAAGLARGLKVRMRGHDFTVIDATEKTASLRLDGGTVSVGEGGTANVDRAAANAVKMLPKPRAQTEFTDQWPEPVHPADTQTPTAVPLGAGRAPGRAHVTVIGHGYGTVAKGNGIDGDVEGRVIASFDLLDDRPLAADADVAGRAYVNGWNAGTNTPLFVRVAQLRYGNEYDPTFALGRLRFAASSVGMLDGARVAVHAGAIEVAAFGGALPDPTSGKPDTSTSRFGAEGVWDDRTSSWRPRVAVVAYGSTWQGTLDERRLSLVASANHGATSLDGWAEAQQFPGNNPWGASSVELTGGGGNYQWQEHGEHAGVGVTYLKPERSLRLAAALPPDWLCTRNAQGGNVPETCSSGDYWVTTSANAGIRRGRWSVDAIGTVGESHGVYRGYDGSGYLRGEVELAGGVRGVLGASTGIASFARWTSGEVGLGLSLGQRFDAIATYRPEYLDYNASTGAFILHSATLDGHYALSRSFELGGSALATTGQDRQALAVLGTIVWRPLP